MRPGPQENLPAARQALAEFVRSKGTRCLFLVRHGQTAWNAQSRLQGRQDVPLNERGRSQALSIADLLSTIPLDRVYCSTLVRSLDTAQEIGRSNVSSPAIIRSSLLDEMALGVLEGEYEARQSTVQLAQFYQALCADEINFRVPCGGESLADVGRRVDRFYAEERSSLEACGNQLIVGHRNVNKMLVKRLLSLSLAEGFQVEHENQRIYLYFGDAAELWSCWAESPGFGIEPGYATTDVVYA